MADAKLTALTAVSVPALDDLSYLVDVSDTTDDAAGSSRSVLLSRLMGLAGVLPGGRLTLTTATPVTTSDVTGATTIYYTPYVSDYVRLYDGTRIKEYAFTERSLALGTITTLRPYDVWLYDNAGTLTMELLAWTSDTARATALAWQTGLGWVKSGDATRLFIGTFRTTSTTTTEDSVLKRFVWNAYNRVGRKLLRRESTANWSYNSSTWRQARADAANQVEVVCGLAGIMVNIRLFVTAQTGATSSAEIGIGIGRTNGSDADVIFRPYNFTSGGTYAGAALSDAPLGYQYYAWTESRVTGANSATYYSGSQSEYSGLSGEVMA